MPEKNRPKIPHLPQILIIGGVVLLALVMLVLKDRPQSQPTLTGGSSALPEAQLERALKAGKPTLAFFHSNTCEQCLQMIATIEKVFPEFSGAVTLVDVNVYDKANEAFLDRAKIQLIPTLVFYERNGQSQTHVGPMEADVLRQELNALAGEP